MNINNIIQECYTLKLKGLLFLAGRKESGAEEYLKCICKVLFLSNNEADHLKLHLLGQAHSFNPITQEADADRSL